MRRKSFYILSCGFTFLTLNFKFFSTLVVSALQIHLFMQNEPNFRKSQMNVNNVLTRDYEKRTLGQRGKNKPNQSQSKPISEKAEMNVSTFTKVIRPPLKLGSFWVRFHKLPNLIYFHNPLLH